MLASVLVGCGSEATSESSSSANSASTRAEAGEQTATEQASSEVPDACSLLTTAEIEQTVGMPISEVDGPKEPDATPGGSLCNWDDADLSGYLQLSISPNGDPVTCEVRRQAAEQMKHYEIAAIDGLGVPADWHNASTNQSICMEIDGMPVDLFSFIEPKVGQSKMEALAKIVISRF